MPYRNRNDEEIPNGSYAAPREEGQNAWLGGGGKTVLALAEHWVRFLKIAERDMSKLCICLAIAVVMSLAGCGVRYNWVPQGEVEHGAPNVEYQGVGVPDPNSDL